MAPSKRTALVLDAIEKAQSSLALVPDSEEARSLDEQCERLRATANAWTHAAPTPEEREALMRKVVALHIAVTKLRRRSQPPG